MPHVAPLLIPSNSPANSDSPISLSSLSRTGQWQCLPLNEDIQIEADAFDEDCSAESEVFGLKNRGNIDLSVILFHLDHNHISINFVDLETNQKTKLMWPR